MKDLLFKRHTKLTGTDAVLHIAAGPSTSRDAESDTPPKLRTEELDLRVRFLLPSSPRRPCRRLREADRDRNSSPL